MGDNASTDKNLKLGLHAMSVRATSNGGSLSYKSTLNERDHLQTKLISETGHIKVNRK